MIHEELYVYDAAVRAERGALLCGVDEAGRGPLCGPVCCAAVILRPESRFDGLTDSKKVTEKRRETLYGEIVRDAVCWAAVLVDSKTIDDINILQATMRGMAAAVAQLGSVPDLVLVDGNRLPALQVPGKPLVHGDATSACIAAASILAKVTRDRYMLELDRKYPQYGFAQHKGYPTQAHYEAIGRYGICKEHRRSFLKGRI